MEWVLQVVDEIDDAVAAVRHGLIGVNAQIAVLAGAMRAAASAAIAPIGSITSARVAKLRPRT